MRAAAGRRAATPLLPPRSAANAFTLMSLSSGRVARTKSACITGQDAHLSSRLRPRPPTQSATPERSGSRGQYLCLARSLRGAAMCSSAGVRRVKLLQLTYDASLVPDGGAQVVASVGAFSKSAAKDAAGHAFHRFSLLQAGLLGAPALQHHPKAAVAV